MTKRDFGVYERDEKRFSLWGANILEPRSLSIVQKFAVLSQISTLVAWPFLNLPLSRAPTRWRYKRPWDWGWQPFAIYPRCLREDKEASKTREELRRRFSRCLLALAPGKKKKPLTPRVVAITNVTKFTAISRWKPDTHFNLKRLVRKAVTRQLTFGNWWNVASVYRNVMNKEQSWRFSSLWEARKKNKCLNLAIRTMPVDGKHFGFYCNCLPNKQFNPTWNLASDEWIRSMRL